MANKALIIGVSDYKPFAVNLPSAIYEARAWCALLRDVYGFSERDIKLIENERATKSTVVDRLTWLLAHASRGDKLVFIFCGHGARTPRRNGPAPNGALHQEVLVLHPAGATSLEEIGLRDEELADIYRTISVPAGALPTFIFDCCFAGGLDFTEMQTQKGPPAPPPGLGTRDRAAAHVVRFGLRLSYAARSVPPLVIAATAAASVAREIEEGRNRRTVFSSVAIEALRRDPGLTYGELVKIVASRSNLFAQKPSLTGDGERLYNPVFE